MPQLKSGRHVALSASPLLDKIKFGSDTGVSHAIMVYRLEVTSPQKLRDFLTIGYFREGEGGPPNAPSYDSGFLVKDVLAGKAGWSADEIGEFEQWFNTSPQIQSWLDEEFLTINQAIEHSLVWDTPLWTDDDAETPSQ